MKKTFSVLYRAAELPRSTEAHCFFQGKREEGGEGSAWLARLGAPCAAELPRSTEAHCKVTTHYLLPSSPYSLLLLLFSFPDCGENLREELFFSGEDTCHIVDILPDLLIWQCLGNALRSE